MATEITPQEYMLDPLGRVRFFGVYEGTVISINDPLSKKRIQLSVTITGSQVTGWARACLPPISIADHPDHAEHTAAQIATLLTTTPVSVTDSRGDTETVPALTVVAKSGAGTLKHPHKTVANTAKKWNDAIDIVTTEEHTPHRLLPKVGDKVWVMFIAGIPEEPVWIGVQ
jgi:hypothetical protein